MIHEITKLRVLAQESLTCLLPFTLHSALDKMIFTNQGRFDPKLPEQKEIDTPILLIHGLGANETQWTTGRRVLRQNLSHTPIYSLNLMYDDNGKVQYFRAHPTFGLLDLARIVQQKIRQITQETGRKDIKIIGHSMGGLVGSTYAEFLSHEDMVHIPSIITMGTPWYGVKWFEKFPFLKTLNTISQELGPKHNFLARLRDRALKSDLNRRREYFHILGSKDFLVSKREAILIKDSDRICEFKKLGHHGIIANPKVYREIILKWLMNH